MSMRFLFAQPDLRTNPERDGAASSLATLVLTSHLQSVESIRSRYQISTVSFVPTSLASLRFTDRNREYYLNKLLVPRPVAIGFSLYVWNVPESREMARLLKVASPDTLLIAGGPETADGKAFLTECPEFDVAVEGEGQVPLAAILERLAEGRTEVFDIPNVWQRTPAGVKGGSDGTSLRITAQAGAGNFYPDCTPPHTAFISIGSGCPNRCSYCLWAKTPAVAKPPEAVLAELSQLLELGVKRIFFCDADLVDLRRRSPHIYQSMAQSLASVPGVRTRLFANVVHLGDNSLEEVLREMGAAWMHLGLQSLQPHVLSAVGRNWSIPSLSNLERTSEFVRDRLIVEMMYPLPEETFSSLWGGVQRLIDLGYSQINLYPASAFRGTTLRRQIQHDPGYAFQPHAPYYVQQTPRFSREEWLLSAPVSYVLNQLASLAAEAPEGGTGLARRALSVRPNVVKWLLEQFASGVDPSDLVGKMVQEVFPRPLKFQFEGPHIVDFSGGAMAKTGGPLPVMTPVKPTPAVAPVSPESLGLPTEAQVLGILAGVGAQVDGMALESQAWRIEARTAGGPLNISIRPATYDGAVYGTMGEFKVTYQGSKVDFQALDQLCGKYHFAGRRSPDASRNQ